MTKKILLLPLLALIAVGGYFITKSQQSFVTESLPVYALTVYERNLTIVMPDNKRTGAHLYGALPIYIDKKPHFVIAEVLREQDPNKIDLAARIAIYNLRGELVKELLYDKIYVPIEIRPALFLWGLQDYFVGYSIGEYTVLSYYFTILGWNDGTIRSVSYTILLSKTEIARLDKREIAINIGTGLEGRVRNQTMYIIDKNGNIRYFLNLYTQRTLDNMLETTIEIQDAKSGEIVYQKKVEYPIITYYNARIELRTLETKDYIYYVVLIDTAPPGEYFVYTIDVFASDKNTGDIYVVLENGTLSYYNERGELVRYTSIEELISLNYENNSLIIAPLRYLIVGRNVYEIENPGAATDGYLYNGKIFTTVENWYDNIPGRAYVGYNIFSILQSGSKIRLNKEETGFLYDCIDFGEQEYIERDGNIVYCRVSRVSEMVNLEILGMKLSGPLSLITTISTCTGATWREVLKNCAQASIARYDINNRKLYYGTLLRDCRRTYTDENGITYTIYPERVLTTSNYVNRKYILTSYQSINKNSGSTVEDIYIYRVKVLSAYPTIEALEKALEEVQEQQPTQPPTYQPPVAQPTENITQPTTNVTVPGVQAVYPVSPTLAALIAVLLIAIFIMYYYYKGR